MERRQPLSLMAVVSSAPLLFRFVRDRSDSISRIVSTDGLLELSQCSIRKACDRRTDD